MYHYTSDISLDMQSAPLNQTELRKQLLSNQTSPERYMEHLLQTNLIKYCREFIILSYINGAPRYQYLDFFVPLRKIAIEIDGSQHRDTSNLKQQSLDNQKNLWCKHHNVILIRICSHVVIANGGFALNSIEMIKWSKIIHDSSSVFNYLQYGSGFGQPVTDYKI